MLGRVDRKGSRVRRISLRVSLWLLLAIALGLAFALQGGGIKEKPGIPIRIKWQHEI